jgi:hypothetical protein
VAEEKKKGVPQEDAIIARLRATPDQAPTGIISYTGLLGRSSRPGYWQLYLSLDMAHWIEISETDIVHSEQLPADRSPFGSLGGTQVFVKADATLKTSTTVSKVHPANEPPDEFDLDLQLGAGEAVTAALPTAAATCRTCRTNCGPTCPVANTCITCATCQTHCGTCVQTCANTCAATCAGTCHNTCAYSCLGTCNTCNTNCNQATCNTCQTNCGNCKTVSNTCAAPKFCP